MIRRWQKTGKEEKRNNRRIYTEVKCTCGLVKWVRRDHLFTYSFGCRTCSGQDGFHRETKTRLYKAWTGMKYRCASNKAPSAKTYHHRGITVCKEWADDYRKFRDWAIANNYQDNLTLDRIDVNGNYEPENCRWATHIEQQRNKTNTRTVEIGKYQMSLADWCEKLGANYTAVFNRARRFTYQDAILIILLEKANGVDKRGYVQKLNGGLK